MNKKSSFIVGMIAILILAAVGGYFVLTGKKQETSEIIAKETEATEEPVESPVPTATPIPTATPMPIESPAPTESPALQDVEQAESGDASAEVSEIEIEALNKEMYAIQNVNLREGTAITTEALRTISFGEQVSVIGITTDHQWYQVSDGDNIGYVASSYLSDTKPQENASEAQRENPSNGEGLSAPKQESSSNESQSSQASSRPSSIPGVPQEELDAIYKEIDAVPDYTGPNASSAMEGAYGLGGL